MSTIQKISTYFSSLGYTGDTVFLINKVSNLFHDFLSKHYDNDHNEIFQGELNTYITNALSKIDKEEFSDFKILEIGSGTGFLSKVILDFRKVKSMTCLEPSEKMILLAKNNLKDYENVFFQNDYLDQISPNEKFDLIISNSVLHHIPDPNVFLRDINSRLKSGGYYLLSHEPNNVFFTSEVFRIYCIIRYIDRFIGKLLRTISNEKVFKTKQTVNDYVNETLLQEGLIKGPLKGNALRKLVDIHVPTVSGDSQYDWGEKGFEVNTVAKIIKNASVISLTTYEHFRSKYFFRSPYSKRLMMRIWPKKGQNFVSLIKK